MDMQGSKIAITLPTGQVVEYELMRVGTVREHRDLGVAHKDVCGKLDAALSKVAGLADAAKTVAAGTEGIAGARDSALRSCEVLTRQRDEVKAELAALVGRTEKTEATRADKSERTASLAQKIESDKAALEKLLAEILGAVDQLNED